MKAIKNRKIRQSQGISKKNKQKAIICGESYKDEKPTI